MRHPIECGLLSVSVSKPFALWWIFIRTQRRKAKPIFDTHPVTIKFLMAETDIAPFDSDSDSDSDLDRISLRE